MKKISILLAILMIFTTTSYAVESPKSETIKSIEELSSIDNELYIVINNIINCNYNKDKESQTLSFIRTRLGDVMYMNYVYYSSKDIDLLSNRESAIVIYTASVYGLAINALAIYLEDPDRNQSYLIDAIAQYKSGNTSLLVAKEFVKERK